MVKSKLQGLDHSPWMSLFSQIHQNFVGMLQVDIAPLFDPVADHAGRVGPADSVSRKSLFQGIIGKGVSFQIIR